MTDKKKRSLLDSTHVWILPQYVRSQWWEIDGDENDPLPNQYTTNCSDAAILDILNRINLLVLDSIKYNLRGSGDSGYQGAEYTLVSMKWGGRREIMIIIIMYLSPKAVRYVCHTIV